jgi:hypothetical protein
MPAIRGILRESAVQDDRFSAIIVGIVKSVPFQMRRKAAGETAEISTTEERRTGGNTNH